MPEIAKGVPDFSKDEAKPPRKAHSTKIHPKIPKEVQSELLREFLRIWLETSPADSTLKGVLTEQEIVDQLTKKYPRYNKENGKGSKQIRQREIRVIKRLALEEIGITVLIGKGRDIIYGDFDTLKSQFEKLYELKGLYVPPPHAGPSSNIHLLYREAATAFKDLIETHGENPMVSIGGGKTIFQMLYYLEHIDKPFEIRALNSATRTSDTEVFDSCYLAHAAHRLCHKSKVKVISLPPLHENSPEDAIGWHKLLWTKNPDIRTQFEEGQSPDIVFVGTGGFSEESPSISRFYEQVGISYADLEPYGPIGDINLCFFDKGGNDVTGEIVNRKWGKKRKSYFTGNPDYHPFLLGSSIHRLRTLVAEGKTVVLVAGGDRRKTKAIKTLLEAKVVNALVTDQDTMTSILSPKLYSSES